VNFAGSYQQALQCYKQIHRRFPDSVDCLKFLVRLCSDLGLKDVQEYSLKLKKAEKLREAKRQVKCPGHLESKSVDPELLCEVI